MSALLQPCQFGDDEIFYGSVRTSLARVPGRAVPYRGTYAPDGARDGAGLPSRTLARKDPIAHPSDGGAGVVSNGGVSVDVKSRAATWNRLICLQTQCFDCFSHLLLEQTLSR